MIRKNRAIRAAKQRPAPDGSGEAGHALRAPVLSARLILMAVMAFSLVFGAVIVIKLGQERASMISESERSQARTAAFLAERASANLAELRGAVSQAATGLDAYDGDFDQRIETRLASLAGSSMVETAALLIPDGRILRSGDTDLDLRAAADSALAEDTGLAALPQAPGGPRLVLGEPAPLPGGQVGAVIAILNPQAVLPQWGQGSVTLLTDKDGRTLAIHPQVPLAGAPIAAERFGLNAGQLSAMAERGGALSGIEVAGDARILGAAALTNAPLQAYALGPANFNQAVWRKTLIFYGLLFLAPLVTAVALSALLLMQMDKLNEAQGQLVESDRRFRLAIEGARCGVWDWDLANDQVFMMDSFARMVGRPNEQSLTGSEFMNLLRAEDRTRLRAALRAAPNSSELDVEVRANQLPVWLHMRGRPFADGTHHGQRIVGVAIDVTERKGAQARVAAAESRLRAALESMNESFVLWDSRNRLVLWNRKFRDFFNLDEGALKPGTTYDQVEELAGSAIRAVHAREEGSEFYELELGDGRWLHYSERPTADGGLVSVGADITAIKIQEQALKENDRAMRRTVDDLKRSQERIQELAKSYEEEKIRAEEANRSKSEFLANMSHELRTPLNAINGFSEIMLREMFGPLGHERYADYVNDILNSGQHLLSLINDILDMSKIEAGKMHLQAEPIVPHELIEQCVRLMAARAQEKQIEIKVEGDELAEIEADPRAIKQVILNLMSNAVKFTPEGGKVVVRTFDASDGIVLQVADSGIGIAKEDIPRLGRPFEQIESQHSKTHQGSGLGLALSKSLIDMHGGTLRIDSELGKGTTVSFSLPKVTVLVQDESDEEAA